MLKRIALILLGFVFAFLFLEFCLHAYYDRQLYAGRYDFNTQLGLVPRPNAKGRYSTPGLYTYSYSHDPEGYRYSGPSPSQIKTKILLLGDSFTYGIGVNDYQTFAAIVQRRLLPYSAKIFNAGMPGIGTDYALRFFQVRGKKLHPDLTIMCFFPHDFIRNEMGWYFDLNGGRFQPHRVNEPQIILHAVGIIPYQRRVERAPLTEWLLSWSYLANFIDLKLHPHPWGVTALRRYVSVSNAKLTRQYLMALKDECEAAGSRFAVFYVCSHGDVAFFQDHRKFSDDETAARELCKNAGITFVSFTPVFAKFPVNSLFFPEDGHWTKAGHALAGEFMANYIQRPI